ncbi:MAG: hypothetical protein HKN14_06735 [Marinicaulis sp.]|nr:hypothetical protein [Marinicaulis sp.]NNL89392.1 hypothetical protein [Marinicaulis sp.]
MLLRRITEHVKAQNWFAVFLDFLIVVVGVFIGIQVSNWNDARAVDRKSVVVSERLTSDLRHEAWNYQYTIEYYKDVQSSGYRALNALTGKADLSDEALLINAYRATQYLVNARRRLTFDELSSTGEIELIRDENLRQTAHWIYNAPVFGQIIRERDNQQYRSLFRMLVSLDVQDALLEKCGDREVVSGDFENIVDSLDYSCETGIAPERVSETARILRSDASMVPLLRLRMADVKSSIANLTIYNMEAIDGLLMIENAD